MFTVLRIFERICNTNDLNGIIARIHALRHILHAYIHLCTHARLYTHTYIYTYIHLCTNIHIFTCIDTHIEVINLLSLFAFITYFLLFYTS